MKGNTCDRIFPFQGSREIVATMLNTVNSKAKCRHNVLLTDKVEVFLENSDAWDCCFVSTCFFQLFPIGLLKDCRVSMIRLLLRMRGMPEPVHGTIAIVFVNMRMRIYDLFCSSRSFLMKTCANAATSKVSIIYFRGFFMMYFFHCPTDTIH